MARRILTAAFGEYDRTWPLRSGDVRVAGVELDLEFREPGEIFRRMCTEQAYDVSEMSLASHCALIGAGESPFVGIPAFPSRAFRHGMVLVNEQAGIREPADLNGKRIGIREWGMTAVVWIVGILSEHYGFEPGSARWLAAKPPRVPMGVPPGLDLEVLPAGGDVAALLAAAELDAALVFPSTLPAEAPGVRSLFDDPAAEERAWFEKTRLHPLMHTVVLRRSLHEGTPQLATRLFRALCDARVHALDALRETGVLSTMLPLLPAHLAETHALFGEDFWPYGLEPNRSELETLLHYAHQQALTPRRLAPEELFAASFSDAAPA